MNIVGAGCMCDLCSRQLPPGVSCAQIACPRLISRSSHRTVDAPNGDPGELLGPQPPHRHPGRYRTQTLRFGEPTLRGQPSRPALGGRQRLRADGVGLRQCRFRGRRPPGASWLSGGHRAPSQYPRSRRLQMAVCDSVHEDLTGLSTPTAACNTFLFIKPRSSKRPSPSRRSAPKDDHSYNGLGETVNGRFKSEVILQRTRGAVEDDRRRRSGDDRVPLK